MRGRGVLDGGGQLLRPHGGGDVEEEGLVPVVGRGEVPLEEPLLGGGERGVVLLHRPGGPARCEGAPGGAVRDEPRQRGDRRFGEEARGGHLVAAGLEVGDDLDGVDGGPAGLVEGVVGAERAVSQGAFPGVGHLGDERVPGGERGLGHRTPLVGQPLLHQGAQRPVVGLAVGVEREGVEHHDAVGDHVGRKVRPQLPPQRVAFAAGCPGEDHGRHQGRSAAGPVQGGGVRDPGQAAQPRLHVAEFHPVAADLHLAVAPAEELQDTVGVGPDPVAGAVDGAGPR